VKEKGGHGREVDRVDGAVVRVDLGKVFGREDQAVRYGLYEMKYVDETEETIVEEDGLGKFAMKEDVGAE